MRPGLFILPFFGVFLAAMATVLKGAFPEIPWIAQLAYATAAGSVALWVVLEIEKIKQSFARRGAKYGMGSGLSVIVGVLIIVGVAMLASRPRFNKSYDATRSGSNTLSEQSLKLALKASESEEPVKLVAFMQDEQMEATLRDLLVLYTQVAPNLSIEYVDPRTNPLRVAAAKLTTANTLIVKRAGHEARINQFTEEKLTNALVKVLKDQSQKVYFTKGHGEGDLRSEEAVGFSASVTELENNKYVVEELSLLERGAVPDDADLVLIAGPVYEFREEEIRMLGDYIKQGGALMTMVDAARPVKMLNKLLSEYGLQYNNDFLILRPDDPRSAILGQNTALVGKFDESHHATKDLSAGGSVVLTMANTRSVKVLSELPEGLKADVIANTSPAIIEVTGVVDESSLGNVSPERIKEGEFGVVAAASGNVNSTTVANLDDEAATPGDRSDAVTGIEAKSGVREVRVVAVGSSHLASNYGAQLAENRDMFVNLVNFLLQDEDFISIRPKNLEKSYFNVTSGSSQLLLFFLCFIYPFMFLGAGVIHWLKRRSA